MTTKTKDKLIKRIRRPASLGRPARTIFLPMMGFFFIFCGCHKKLIACPLSERVVWSRSSFIKAEMDEWRMGIKDIKRDIDNNPTTICNWPGYNLREGLKIRF